MKKIKRIIVLLLTLLLLSSMSGCSVETEEVDIYASIYPIYFLAQEIVQDKLTVKQVYPMGADVHDYDPGHGSALVSMSQAKLMFYIGFGLESFIDNAKDKIFANSNIKLVELGEYVTLIDPIQIQPLENVHEHDVDTHVWLDPLRMVTFAKIILREVVEISPENEEFFLENGQRLISELEQLDQEYTEALNQEDIQKVILVDHDSYAYWEDRYGIKRIRTRVDNESCDVIPADWEKNVELAKKYQIRYVVTTKNESSCSIVDKYAKELNAKIVELNHISTLTKKEFNDGENYFTIMRSNLETLVKILPKK